MRNFTLRIATAATFALIAGAAAAASVTTSFQVSATVISTCTVSATDLVFGNYSPVATVDSDSASTVAVQCTNLTPYEIGLGAGGGSGATVAERRMTKDAQTLTYSLYQDLARNTVWGDSFGAGGNAVSAIGNGLSQSHTVYGRIPKGQNVNIGTYTDTVLVTVNF